MANIMTGVAIARGLTDLLNDICKTEGGIRRNDPRIWDDYLHKMTNDEWADLTAAMDALYQDSPGCFKHDSLDVLRTAQKELTASIAKDKSFVGRPMIARSGNKATAWRLIMIMREIVNDYNGVYIANRPGPVDDLKDLQQTQATNIFNTIFEIPNDPRTSH